MATTVKMMDWENAVPVDISKRDAWIDHVFSKLINGQPHCTILSGDTLVVGVTYPDGSKEIFDCRVRRKWRGVNGE